jgi:ABC-2 type transport system permease protein
MVEVTKIKSSKRRDIIALLTSVGIIVIINFIAQYYFKRFDLTSEKRYTLAATTKKMLSELKDDVYLKIYLDGSLNPGFTRLKNETRELLDEFKTYSKSNIQYEFINPNESVSKDDQTALEKQLYDKGIIPEQVIDRQKEKTSESLIWPGAIVSHNAKDMAWQLFTRQVGIPPEASINNAVQELEYGLTNTIRKLQSTRKKEITFIEGHGELDTLFRYDFMRSLSEYYNVNRVTILEKLKALEGSDAIVITRPDSAFSDKDKFIIDQFIMKGGKVLWLVDPVQINPDTFRLKGFTMGLKNELRIDDMLFKYGVRLNPILVQDLQCASVPVNIGFTKGQPNFKLFPWIYHPLILPDLQHPIVRNLDLIKTEFCGTLDTISAKGIKKTILLRTSRYTRLQQTPARISLSMVRFKPKEEQFKEPYQPIACLLEGAFNSVFENRLPMAIMKDSAINYKMNGVSNKMIVVADGDIARNDFQRSNGAIMPLGYDRYSNQTYANKAFLLNCMNYLLDDEGLLQLRSREVKLRLLDKKKIEVQKAKWQFINMAIPLALVLGFGVFQFYYRKRKFAR